MAEENKSNLKPGFVTGTGRRKTAVARVFLWKEKGDFTINGMPMEKYFPSEQQQLSWMRPFHAIGVSHPGTQFTASIKVEGSGKSAQIDAVVLGLSRALVALDEKAYGETLKANNLLSRDPRMVERKKYWLKKARKSPQYSKR